MKPNRKTFLLIAAVGGLSAGFVLRRLQNPPGPDAASLSASLSLPENGDARTVDGRRRPGASTPALAPVAVELKQELAVSSGVERWLVWMSALEKAKLSDLPQLSRLAKGNPVVLRIIAERWIEQNPEHLFETLAEFGSRDASLPVDELINHLMEEWTRRDPAALLAAMDRRGHDLPRDLRTVVAVNVIAKDPELGLKTMNQWQIENFAPRSGVFRTWAEKDPLHAAKFALANPAGFATQMAMKEIGEVWAARDPEAALTFAAGVKERYGNVLAEGVMQQWAQKDTARAAAWLGAAKPAVRNRLSAPLLETWATQDPQGAMHWIDHNLTGSAMDDATGAVLSGVAANSVPDAAALVSHMDESRARARAAVSVAQKWFPRYSGGGQESVPAEAVTWLSSLDPESIRQVTRELHGSWAHNDPASFATFLTTPAGAHAADYAYSSTARSIARSDPQAGLKWAAQLPLARRAEAEQSVFQEWQNAQPAAALEWARALPAGDPQRVTFFSAALRGYLSDAPAEQAAQALAAGNTAVALSVINVQSIDPALKNSLLERLRLK